MTIPDRRLQGVVSRLVVGQVAVVGRQELDRRNEARYRLAAEVRHLTDLATHRPLDS
jgi:hypothetical protein